MIMQGNNLNETFTNTDNIGTISYELNRCQRSGVRVPMDNAEFERIKNAFERNGGMVIQNCEWDRHLDKRNADASSFGSDTMIFRSGTPPTRSELFEELIHTSQNRQGRFYGPSNVVEMEIEAKRKLVANQRVYGISDVENAETIRQLNSLLASE